MDASRKELKSKYKAAGTPAGIFQVRNLINGKIYIGTAENIPGILNSNKFQLNCGSHKNPRLQEEWKQYGLEAFAFEALDELKVTEENGTSIRSELSQLLKLWLEKLCPYEERGYNERPK